MKLTIFLLIFLFVWGCKDNKPSLIYYESIGRGYSFWFDKRLGGLGDTLLLDGEPYIVKDVYYGQWYEWINHYNEKFYEPGIKEVGDTIWENRKIKGIVTKTN